MKSVEMFGLSMSGFTLAEAAETFSEIARKTETRLIFTANAEHIGLMNSNEEFRSACIGADFIVSDGMSLVWFSRLLGQGLPERVTGSDLLPELCRIAEKKGLKVFFLGGMPEVTPKAVESLIRRYPSLKVAGMATPWIDLNDRQETHREVIESINSSQSDIVFIGFGAPKQEIWASRNRTLLRTGIVLGVGGTFDFLAGKTVRAPLWMQKAGFEWLWRLVHEPKRLWRRYLIGNLRFLTIAWKEWQKQRTSK
jgi:N-acetylglucosaminyldiphosphoundecaprenol N-acetyl-beta-D-mannosaminyltransferase